MSSDGNPVGVHAAPLEPGASPQPRAPAALSPAVAEAAHRLYAQANASRFALSVQQFVDILAAVLAKYANGANDTESLALLELLRVEELALARACADGNAAAWDEFLNRYRAKLYDAALGIAHDEATARELADGLYAELYGLPSADGVRASKLNYYMGRGSLEGWLRTVLAQEYVNRYRAQKRTVSLEEQIESGVSFAAAPTVSQPAPDMRLERATASALAILSAEEKFLLVAYFLDRQTLAEIASQLRVHESTISRKIDRLTKALRKSIRKQLLALGMNPRQADECMNDAEVGELQIDVRKTLDRISGSCSSGGDTAGYTDSGSDLKQETVLRPFYKGDDSKP
ncbi:MAG: sigma-70 family RNA polymerase sigma factor [Candidatus Korobacteraceae bacterium]|jgi:RNA polymerase sigma-70 factor (ECF subfamily)